MRSRWGDAFGPPLRKRSRYPSTTSQPAGILVPRRAGSGAAPPPAAGPSRGDALVVQHEAESDLPLLDERPESAAGRVPEPQVLLLDDGPDRLEHPAHVAARDA